MVDGWRILEFAWLWIHSAWIVYFSDYNQMALEVYGHNLMNWPADMMDNPVLVHFKTIVGYFYPCLGNNTSQPTCDYLDFLGEGENLEMLSYRMEDT